MNFWNELLTAPGKAAFLISICIAVVFMIVGYLRFRLRRKQGQESHAKSSLMRAVPKQVETVTLAEIRADLQRLETRANEWSARITERLAALSSRSIESSPAESILDDGTSHERANLAAILGIALDSNAITTISAIRAAGSHAAAVAVRKLRGLELYVDYDEVARDVATKLGAPSLPPTGTAAAAEQSAIEAAFKKMLADATPEQRKALEEEIAKTYGKSAYGIGAAGGALTLAHFSGFGLYMAASSVLAGITGALHLTLPFAVYMGMSSTLAVIIGPVGWVALAAAGVAKLGAANYKKTIPGVIAIATIRARLIAERDQEIDALSEERDGDLARFSAKAATLRSFIESMVRDSQTAAPKGSVPL